MPYNIELPDGRVVTNIPDDVKPEQAKARLLEAYPDLATTTPPATGEFVTPKPTAPAERPEDQSIFRQVADVPLQFQKGFVSGIRLLSDVFGADSSTSKNLRLVEDHLAGLMSAQSKQDSAEMARIMKDAEDKGIGDQLVAGVKALSVAPVDTVVNALGTTAPTILAGLAGGHIAAGALGTAMGAGTIKGSIYDAVKQVLGDTKMSPEDIEARAVKAQEYFGDNADMIATGAGLGLLESITGVQPAVNKIIARTAVKKAAETTVEDTAKKTMAGAVLKGAVKEATPEFFQGAQEQLAQNIAQQREGFDTPTMQGVITQGTLEAGAGAMMGGVTGPVELAAERKKVNDLKTKLDELQNTPPPPGSEEERVIQLAAEIQARGNVDRQNAMILAMKIVADESVLSQEVDGAKPPEQSGEAPLFVFDTPEQAQERTRLLKLNRPKENFEVQGTPDGKFAIYKIPVVPAGEADATGTVPPASGVSATVPSQVGGAAVPAGGAVTPIDAGLDTTGAVAEQPVVGEAVQPSALEVTPVAQPTLEAPPTAAIEPAPVEETAPKAEEVVAEPAPEPTLESTPEGKKVLSAKKEHVEVYEAKKAIEAAAEAAKQLEETKKLRAAENRKRKKGEAEPPKLRQLNKKDNDKLEAAITGKSGLVHVINKLGVEIDKARAALEPYGGEEVNPDLLRQRGLTMGDRLASEALESDEAILSEDQKAELHAQDMEDMRDAYGRYRALKEARAEAIQHLAEFEGNPRFDGHPSKEGALNAIRSLPYEEKLAVYKKVAEKYKTMLEPQEEAPVETPTETKPKVAVQVKKRRTVEIPPTSQARKSKKLGASLIPDRAFNSFSGKPITEVLAHIATKGSPFERALATRLLARDNRAGLKESTFHVVDPEEAAGIPEMDDANGVYILDYGSDDIYVRGEGFGPDPANLGINNQIVLHESVHATVNKRLIYALYAEELNLPVDANLKRTATEIVDLMDHARSVAIRMGKEYDAAGEEVPAELMDLIAGEAFEKVTEFVAYGMTDPYMQKFLRDNVTGVVTRTNGFSQFVESVLELLGLGPEHVSGLRDLIEYTDRLAAYITPDASTAKAIIDTRDKNQVSDIQAVSRAAKKKENKSAEIKEKIETSSSADQIVEELGSLSTVAKNPKLWKEYLSAKFSDINFDAMNVLLSSMPTHMIIETGVDKGITHLADVDADVREIATMRTRILNRVQEISTPWIKLSAPVQKQLGKIMSYATLAQIDPSKESGKDAELDAMYKALPPEAKAVYKNVRSFYQDQYDLYRALLERAAERMGGKEKAPETLNAIKALYETAKNKGPYFPLMRYGQFWARIGKGTNKEFYMFESAGMRDAFVVRRMAELAKKGEKRSFDEMMETDDADRGNDVDGMRKELLKDNAQLQNVFNLIDKASSLGDEKIRASLKDQIYQMHLLSMPEASMRKHFIHRKGVTGFSGDALRNFLNSGTRMASQMARVRYSADINNNMQAARDSLKGNPEKDKLEAIIKEVQGRVNDEMNPPIDDTLLESLARKTNKVAFLYMLTSVKSAANQMFSVLNFTVPTLASRHGWIPTLTEMSKYLALGYGQLGTTKKNIDGSTSWVPPSVGLSDRVANDKEETYAFQRMQDMGISDITRTYDLFLRRGQPSANYNSRWNQVTNMMGALFHHSERISREITFMTSFRLTKGKGLTLEQRVEQATKDTNTALFDYSAWNRPTVLRSAPVRVVAQFKQFPMYVTLYLARNGYNMIKSGATLAERKEAATMLFGTLGMTALMAGASGTVGYSVIMGTIQGIRNALRDEGEEDPLEEKDFELWFRNVYLPELCGDTKIMGMNLSELIDSGALNAATGYDVASGISLNNMWFHDTPETDRWKSGFDNMLISMMGPGVSVGRQVAASIDDFNNGDFLKGVEKLTPAFGRGAVTSMRYASEGAKSSIGAEIKSAEDFTTAQLTAQMLGFRTTGLAQTMNNNFAIQQMVNGLKNERSALMKRLDTAVSSDNDQGVEDTLDAIEEFSAKYPAYRFKPSEINSSLKSREKMRNKAEAGLYLDKRAQEFSALRDRALANLEEESKK